MQKLFPQIASILFTAAVAQARATSQFDTSQWVFTSISGPVRDAVVYAPNPVYPAAALQQRIGGRGVYKLDLDNGIPYDVRIVQSTGYKILDDAAMETLRTWRFRPHRSVWVTIPIEFRATGSPAIAQYPKGTRAVAIYAPKPDFPLEARHRHLTGAGVIVLDVDVKTGQVIDAYMVRSIGHQILDEAALSAFRRWRFQPGKAARRVKVPIRYTLNGSTY